MNEKILEAALQHGAYFYALSPDKTGLRHTLHIPECDAHPPCYIVDDRYGYHPIPTEKSKCYLIFEGPGTEYSNDYSINEYVLRNKQALIDYASGELDTLDLHERLK